MVKQDKTPKNDDGKTGAEKKQPLKPKNPNTKGAPSDNDRNAQYEDKDQS